MLKPVLPSMVFLHHHDYRDRYSLSSSLSFSGLHACELQKLLVGLDAQSRSSSLLRISYALSQQIVRASVSFHGAGDPQAVDMGIPVRLDGNPLAQQMCSASMLSLVIRMYSIRQAPLSSMIAHAAVRGMEPFSSLLENVVFRHWCCPSKEEVPLSHASPHF